MSLIATYAVLKELKDRRLATLLLPHCVKGSNFV